MPEQLAEPREALTITSVLESATREQQTAETRDTQGKVWGGAWTAVSPIGVPPSQNADVSTNPEVLGSCRSGVFGRLYFLDIID